jgi:hypothetical protein
MLQHVSDDLVDHMFGSIHNMVQQNVLNWQQAQRLA